MKKNRMMRLAGFLLVAVLLTTSIISGTFAKYVVEGDITDSARVAKFGVTISAQGSLFSETYYAVGQTNSNMPATGTDTTGEIITVKSSASGQNVVAPGSTNNQSLSFGISGTPEVTVKVTVSAEYAKVSSTGTAVKDIYLKKGIYTDVTGSATNAAGVANTFELTSDYKPIKWTLKKDGNSISYNGGNLDNTDLTTINAYFAKLSTDGDLTFAPGTNLGATGASNPLSGYTLSWVWEFENSDTDTAKLNNKADTVLGDLAAQTPTVKKFDTTPTSSAATGSDLTKDTDYSTDIEVVFTITVEQVD